MPLAKRTSDDEGRIVPGGELPEDEGSLDDVVVDAPSAQEPEESPVYNHPVQQKKQYKHMKPNGELDREALAGMFGLAFKIQTPEEREKSLRIGVDRELAKIFGAKYFMGFDWNLRAPVYTIDEIQDRMDNAGVDFPASGMVKEHLKVCISEWVHNQHYCFEPVLDANNNQKYRFNLVS